MTRTRILVLGCGGFLGSRVTARLQRTPGARILRGGRGAGDGAKGGTRGGPKGGAGLDLAADLATVPVDVLARQLAALAPDAVVDCAGVVAGRASALCATNARGPAALCEAMALATPSARLVHLGSAAEYGPAEPGAALAESAPARPEGVYGAAKLAGTLAVTGSGLDAVVLRVFNPVGAGSPTSGLPGRLAAAFREAPREGVVRTGSLAAYRDFVAADDVADAVALAVAAPGSVPPVVNIGSGKATQVRTLAAELASVSGFTGRLEESGRGSERSAGVSWHQADITLAAYALGWQPTRTLRDALTALWAAVPGEPVRISP
ncbi:NAD-dependent epimerase/dehydratase family protein [Streptomyces sp. NPDC008079]|uniref:NAD-dependent epimerase/dehydratase family protein n=1 Tax=Streptomyces sp. NPDC008079 TaxID=3364806 RepID=UPI0036E3F24B